MAAGYYHHHQPAAAPHYSYYPSPATLADAGPPGVPPPAPPQYPGPAAPYPRAYVPGYDLPPRQPESSYDEEVRTLFIAGLPDDVRHREIFNLFREFPGYQSSQIRCTGKSSKAYAFAVFANQQSAVAAMHATNGMVFDLERDSTLFVELAKSNSRSKRSKTDDGFPYISDEKVSDHSAFFRGFPDSGVRSNMYIPEIDNSAYNTNGYPSAQSYTEASSYAEPIKSLKNIHSSFSSQNNIPCPTLFVAKLGPTCSEQELYQVFSRFPGFLKVKMQKKNGVPVAFVDFKDITCSSGALDHLQGALLHSSVGEGLRLEFAKSRMGLRKRERRE